LILLAFRMSDREGRPTTGACQPARARFHAESHQHWCSSRATTISIDLEADEGSTLAGKVADWKPNPGHLYSQTELREILQRALASLPHSYRVVFLLRDVEGVSVADTAEMLGLSIAIPL
jgi:DNA-directed RNA polymerase specialized sigma24 family protein